jgi:hypothetical protein
MFEEGRLAVTDLSPLSVCEEIYLTINELKVTAYLEIAKPNLAIEDRKCQNMVDKWFGFPSQGGNTKDLCDTTQDD